MTTSVGVPASGGQVAGVVGDQTRAAGSGGAGVIELKSTTAAGYPGGVPAPQWFDGVYRAASGDAAAVPWANLRPNPMMVAWLNAQAPGLVRPGSRVVVVGCGLGDDVSELACRGYDVVGFDISPTAVEWARRRFPSLASAIIQADLLALPPRLLRRFDLVVEIYTLQALPPDLREQAAPAVASLASPRGHVLTIAAARAPDEPLDAAAGPPWPLSAPELTSLMEHAGMRPVRPVEDFFDDEDPPTRRLRGLFSR